MGLRTTNYEVKKLGITLPQAYAIIGEVQIAKSGSGFAKMYIQATRDNALNLQALEEKRIDFKWDRKQDIARCIYEAAKQKKTRMEQNGELDENGMPIEVEVVVDEQFYGWYDDIV
jgi:hypothetical protein